MFIDQFHSAKRLLTAGKPLLLSLAVAGSGCGSDEMPFVGTTSTTGSAEGGVPTTGESTTGSTTGTSTGGSTTGVPTTGGSTTGNPTTGGTMTTTGASTTGGTMTTTGGDATTTGMSTTGGGMPTTGETDGGMPMADGGTDAGGDPVDAGCLADIEGYFDEGPFSFDSTSSGRVEMWIPDVPAGCKVPMIHMSNGTGASCSNYRESMERFASHGFLGLCYDNANTGAGEYGIQAFETALSEYPDLADLKFGSAGHSQGGQAAFVTLQYAEEKWPEGVHAGLPMQPASGFGEQPSERWQTVYGKIKGPVFMFSGNPTDGLVSKGWVSDGFNALADGVEAYHWSKDGGNHIPVPNGETMQTGIAWFRWKLLGDQKACQAFKGIPGMDSSWEETEEQNAQPCM